MATGFILENYDDWQFYFGNVRNYDGKVIPNNSPLSTAGKMWYQWLLKFGASTIMISFWIPISAVVLMEIIRIFFKRFIENDEEMVYVDGVGDLWE